MRVEVPPSAVRIHSLVRDPLFISVIVKAHANWPLRGLSWRSKELFDEQLKQSNAADARELHDIRNAFEHKYLQVHEGWPWGLMLTRPAPDALAFSTDSGLLEAKADRKRTRLNSSHYCASRMPSFA